MTKINANDPHAPNYEIIINGAKMNSSFINLVDTVTIEDCGLAISSIKMTMKYKQNVVGGVSDDLMSMKFISPGNLVVIKGGYGTDLKELGAGHIVELEPDFPEGREPTITVKAYDLLHKLSIRKSKKGETFRDYRDSQIASIIGERHGFYIRIADPTSFFGIRKTSGKKVRVQKRGSTDLAFLKQLAKLNSYDLYCKWDRKLHRFVLFFEPPKDRTKEIMVLTYGDGNESYTMQNDNGILAGTLKSFKPTLSIANQFTRYVVKAYDRKSEKSITHSMTMDEFMSSQEDLKLGGNKAEKLLTNKRAVSSGAGVAKKAFGDNEEMITTKRFQNEKDAKEYLILHMKKLAKSFITGKGSIPGNQYLQSRHIVTLNGLGAFFSGRYFINKITHKFSGQGYDSSVDMRKVIKEEVA